MELLLPGAVGWSMNNGLGRTLPITIHSAYLTRAIKEPAKVRADLVHLLANIDFDSFVVAGVSGLIIAGQLSDAIGKPFLYVRKADESGHSTQRVEGTLCKRWVFVDDFVSSGATLQRVINEVTRISSQTTLVGVAQYMALPTQKVRYTTRQSLRRGAVGLKSLDGNTIPLHVG